MTQPEQQPARGAPEEPGLSRRDVMKRGALVGGAMVWATPVVQTMARPAFAAQGTQVDGHDISWMALVVSCPVDQAGNHDPQGGNEANFRVKYETGDDGGWETNPGPPNVTGEHDRATKGCLNEMDGNGSVWNDATPADGGVLGLQASVDGNTGSVDLSGSDCELVALNAYAFGGNECVQGTLENGVVEFELGF